jgi:hypothetical protein
VIVGVGSVTAGDWNLVALSKILSNGKNFNKQFSQFAVLNTGYIIMDVTIPYAAQFGAPVAGKKIFARFKEVNSSGMSGPNLIMQVPVLSSGVITIPTTTNAVAGTVVSTSAGSGAEIQELWQDQTGSGIFTLAGNQPGVAGVSTFTGVVAGLPSFTRLHVGANYGPRSVVFTSI